MNIAKPGHCYARRKLLPPLLDQPLSVAKLQVGLIQRFETIK